MPSCHSRPLLAAAALVVAGCPKKPTGPVAPIVGWHQEAEGQSFACYHPADFAKMSETERKLSRASVMDEMMSQWLGKREDGVSFDADMVEMLETTLLGDMEKVEAVAQKNLDFCKKASTGGDTAPWGSWLKALPAKLTEGECFNHFDYTMYDYLEIDIGWQRSMGICEDDKVRISGTAKDRFRVEDKGEWINVGGDMSQPAAGTNLPCNTEQCYRGQLILKFTSEDGVETIYPVGEELIFTAPQNGTISYRINDDTFYDNTWYQGGGIIDHASVEITPAN